MPSLLNWIDVLFFGVRQIWAAGVQQPERGAVNFHGSGVTVIDDPTNNWTDIEVGMSSTPTFTNVAASTVNVGSGAYQITGGSQLTTDDTPTTLISLPIPAGKTIFWDLDVIPNLMPSGTNPNITGSSVFIRGGAAWNNPAGNQIFVGEPAGGSNTLGPFLDGTYPFANLFPGTLRASVSGSNLVIQVQGFGSLPAWQPNHPYLDLLSVVTTSNAGGGIAIQTTVAHGLTTGDWVTIGQVNGTTEANGTWSISVVDSTHFTLDGSTYTHAYTSGGLVLVPSPIVSNGGNLYLREDPGTSASSGGPSGTGLSIPDGTGSLRWGYLGPASGGVSVLWTWNLRYRTG